jgi:hypothetical protein
MILKGVIFSKCNYIVFILLIIVKYVVKHNLSINFFTLHEIRIKTVLDIRFNFKVAEMIAIMSFSNRNLEIFSLKTTTLVISIFYLF